MLHFVVESTILDKKKLKIYVSSSKFCLLSSPQNIKKYLILNYSSAANNKDCKHLYVTDIIY